MLAQHKPPNENSRHNASCLLRTTELERGLKLNVDRHNRKTMRFVRRKASLMRLRGKPQLSLIHAGGGPFGQSASKGNGLSSVLNVR
jgi:hypothetical protein